MAEWYVIGPPDNRMSAFAMLPGRGPRVMLPAAETEPMAGESPLRAGLLENDGGPAFGQLRGHGPAESRPVTVADEPAPYPPHRKGCAPPDIPRLPGRVSPIARHRGQPGRNARAAANAMCGKDIRHGPPRASDLGDLGVRDWNRHGPSWRVPGSRHPARVRLGVP